MEMDRRCRKADIQSMTEVEQDSPKTARHPDRRLKSCLTFSTVWKKKGPGGHRALRIGRPQSHPYYPRVGVHSSNSNGSGPFSLCQLIEEIETSKYFRGSPRLKE